MTKYELHTGNCLEVMATLADSSVDSIVTDPPYELTGNGKGGFMGKAWDATGIAHNVDMWREALRVLKPGGHLLAFSGSRTYHRMAVAIEDAGFEIRDSVLWLYGSGFPKSMDVAKAIDKAAGVLESRGKAFNAAGVGESNGGSVFRSDHPDYVPYAPATDGAKQWSGWGTALKPAHEPICMARKPLAAKTVAANVLAHGTGALNIDASRVSGEKRHPGAYHDGGQAGGARTMGRFNGSDRSEFDASAGRWPANVIHDGSPEVLEGFPVTASGTKQGGGYARDTGVHEGGQRMDGIASYGDKGSAARFFYCAKASKADRGEGNTHPTVKPTDLMRYLIALVTQPGGVVLDPFMGSGSTGRAAVTSGFRFIGIDMTPEYVEIARSRIESATPADLFENVTN
jgi:site-specific DNA-methyltransferase (adenine-specific)